MPGPSLLDRLLAHLIRAALREYTSYSRGLEATREGRHDRKVQSWSVRLSLTGAAVAIFGGLASTAISAWQASIARDALFATDRPWIKLTVPLEGVRQDADGNVTAYVKPIYTNIGHEPALRVSFDGQLFLSAFDYAEEKSARDVRRFCDDVRSDKLIASIGNTLFPDSTYETLGGGFTVRLREIKRFREGTKRRLKIDAPALDSDLRSLIRADLVVCARYDVPGDPTPHTTGVLFEVDPPLDGTNSIASEDVSKLGIKPGASLVAIPGATSAD